MGFPLRQYRRLQFNCRGSFLINTNGREIKTAAIGFAYNTKVKALESLKASQNNDLSNILIIK